MRTFSFRLLSVENSNTGGNSVVLLSVYWNVCLQDVEALFHGDGCPKFVDCVFAHNEHWYVTFVNEEDAQRALFFLREKGRTFNGEPIKVCFAQFQSSFLYSFCITCKFRFWMSSLTTYNLMYV